jgi:hypothetical protein
VAGALAAHQIHRVSHDRLQDGEAVLHAEGGGAIPLAFSWNVLGLLDPVVAVGMGTGFLVPLFVPELGDRVPPAAAMGTFPLILVPTFTVPMSVLLHLLALGRLRPRVRVGSGPVPQRI